MSQQVITALPTRVLVVDDSDVFRSAMCACLRTVAGVEIVGEASDGNEAVALTAQLRPSVLLMDVMMAPCSGLEATRRIRMALQPAPRIVLLSAREQLREAALDAGADAFLAKHDFMERVYDVLRVGGSTPDT